MQGDSGDGPPRMMILGALLMAVAAVAVVLGVAATRRSPPPPVVIAAVPAPQSSSPDCRALLAALPDRLGDVNRAVAVEPVPEGAAAWGTADRPVVLRCGLDPPAEFVVGVPLQLVDDVQWFRLTDTAGQRSTWVAVDRPVYVALTLPDGSGPTPIQTISEVIAGAMPVTPIRPAPAR